MYLCLVSGRVHRTQSYKTRSSMPYRWAIRKNDNGVVRSRLPLLLLGDNSRCERLYVCIRNMHKSLQLTVACSRGVYQVIRCLHLMDILVVTTPRYFTSGPAFLLSENIFTSISLFKKKF